MVGCGTGAHLTTARLLFFLLFFLLFLFLVFLVLVLVLVCACLYVCVSVCLCLCLCVRGQVFARRAANRARENTGNTSHQRAVPGIHGFAQTAAGMAGRNAHVQLRPLRYGYTVGCDGKAWLCSHPFVRVLRR